MTEINNLTINPIDENFLKKVAKIVLKGKDKEKIELSIAIVGPGRIRELNKKYRKKNKMTDVLSFLYNGSGEIIICLQQVKKNAKRFGSTFQEEMARVLIHGILHLLGHDHEKSKKGVKIMRAEEEFYLSKIKFN